MWFRVGERIEVGRPTQEFLNYCEKRLVLDNPEYQKKERMGLWLGNTPQKITLYERDGDIFYVPFGCVAQLKALFPDAPFINNIENAPCFSYGSAIDLYDYQKAAVEAALEKRNGVLVMPCGAGKTQTALEIIARLGLKALWLTHTQDLLNQSLDRAKSVFDRGGYGKITGGKVDIGDGLTFATVQTMSKLDLHQYRNTWGAVIADECHKVVGSPTKVMQFYKVLSNLACRYKFGVTATPKRADGLEQSMFALLGDVVYEVGRDAVAGNTCPVKVQEIETGYFPDLEIALAGDGTINYVGLVQDMTANEKRFAFVLRTIEDLPENMPVLVLANRVEYLKQLDQAYTRKSKCLSGMGVSKAAKAERKNALKALNTGEIDCLFATYQLAKEGLDVPNLRYVVFATPEKDPTTIQQAAGRVGRKAEGKAYGTVIDFVDDFGMLKGWAKKRRAIYRRLGYEPILGNAS
jgi:superfamily II DNA or RNA helicase